MLGFDPLSQAPLSSAPIPGAVAYTLLCAPGSYAVTGTDIAFRVDRALSGDAGSYAITGNASTLTYTAGAAVDPDFSSVSLLLHGDGTNGAQNNAFLDSSANNFSITRTGAPTQGSFSPFPLTATYDPAVHGGSGYFGGSGNSVSIAYTSAFAFTTQDFAVESFVYPSIPGTAAGVMSQWQTGGQSGLIINSTGYVTFLFYIASGYVFLNGTTAKANFQAWNHVAVVRNGATLTIYVNGVADATTYNIASSSILYQIGTKPTVIGTYYDGGSPITGYISNFRIVIGSPVYTANFTPPTSPLTAITNTVLLLNFSNAGVYDNASKSDFITVGNAQISTAAKKYGSGSIAFDGTGDWLSFADSASSQLSAGDFTIEGWVYLSATGAARGFISKGTATTGWTIGVDASNKLVFGYTATSLVASTSLSATTWYHFAVVRNGGGAGNLKIYLNGTADATSAGAVTDNFNQTSLGYVGADRSAGNALNGNLDDLRITKGVARYTADFTPPAEAFPDSGPAGGKVDYALACAAGSYALTGQTAILAYVSGALNYSLTCATGAYAYTGQATTVKLARKLDLAAGAYAYQGQAATLAYAGGRTSYTLTCATGTYALTGTATTLKLARPLNLAAGSYGYTGQAATLSYVSGFVNYTLTCATGIYSVTGQPTILLRSVSLPLAAGTYLLTGNAAALTYTNGSGAVNYTMLCDTGVYAYQGQSAVLTHTFPPPIVYSGGGGGGGGGSSSFDKSSRSAAGKKLEVKRAAKARLTRYEEIQQELQREETKLENLQARLAEVHTVSKIQYVKLATLQRKIAQLETKLALLKAAIAADEEHFVFALLMMD